MKLEKTKKTQMDISSGLSKVKDFIVNFVVPLVSLLISVLAIFLYIYPSVKKLPTTKLELEQKTATKQILTTKVSNLNRLVDYQDVLDENLEIVNKVLVPEADVPRLLDQATQIAERAGMLIEKLGYSYGSRASQDSPSGSFDTVSVSMGVSSNFEQLVVFMELIEKASRYVSIPNFRYSVSSRAEEEGTVSSTFSIDSPFIFIQSTAVTDEPIDVDITDPKFLNFMSMLKGLDYYDFIYTDIEAEEINPDEEESLLESEGLEEPVEPVAELTPGEELNLEPETPIEPAEPTLFPTQ